MSISMNLTCMDRNCAKYFFSGKRASHNGYYGLQHSKQDALLSQRKHRAHMPPLIKQFAMASLTDQFPVPVSDTGQPLMEPVLETGQCVMDFRYRFLDDRL